VLGWTYFGIITVASIVGIVFNAVDVEKYQKIAEKCAKEILEKTGKEADITCVQSEMVNVDTFMAAGSKEKQTTTKTLYQVAKAFIHTMEQEVTANED
jgi:hypothetical protein